MGIIIGQFNESFPPVMDGVSTAVVNYGHCLTKYGNRCCVITPKHPNADDSAFDFEVYRYAAIKVPTRGEYRTGLPQMSTSFWMSLKKIPFDIVHAHSPFGAGLAARSLARKKDIPIVATFHSKYRDDFMASIKSEKLVDNIVLMIVNFYESVDEVWAVNEASIETLREYGYRGPVHVVENGCDISPQHPTQADLDEVNRMFNIPPDMPVFVYVGQHIWQKNLKMVMQSLKLLKKRGHSFRMLCVGDGPKRPDMEEMVRRDGLSDCVHFTGTIQQREVISKIYMRSNALLFPSLYDTSGLVSKEAAACGCPTVFVRGANAAKGVTERNGYLIENSPQALANTAEHIILHPEQARRVGEEARRTLYLSWEDAVRVADERYRYLINTKKSRPVWHVR